MGWVGHGRESFEQCLDTHTLKEHSLHNYTALNLDHYCYQDLVVKFHNFSEFYA